MRFRVTCSKQLKCRHGKTERHPDLPGSICIPGEYVEIRYAKRTRNGTYVGQLLDALEDGTWDRVELEVAE